MLNNQSEHYFRLELSRCSDIGSRLLDKFFRWAHFNEFILNEFSLDRGSYPEWLQRLRRAPLNPSACLTLLPQWTSPGTVKKLLDIDDDVGSDGSDIDKKLLQPMDKRFRRSTTSLATMSSSETSQQTSIESSFLGPMLQNLFVSVVHAKFWYPGFDLIW